METVLLAFMLIAAVCIGAATYNLMKISSLPARERYKVLRFKGDSLTIGYGLFAHTYKLNGNFRNTICKISYKRPLESGRLCG